MQMDQKPGYWGLQLGQQVAHSVVDRIHSAENISESAYMNT